MKKILHDRKNKKEGDFPPDKPAHQGISPDLQNKILSEDNYSL
ncbi:hypothetical protein RSJ42_00525 [Methanosarcina hadiensis]